MNLHRQPHTSRRYTSYAALAGATKADKWHEIRYERPSHQPTTGADVVVPLLQSLISGAVAAVVTGSILGVINHQTGTLGAWVIWGALGAFAMITGAVWASLLTDHRRLLWEIETWTRQDLDGDGATGKPQAEPLRVRVEEQKTTGASWADYSLPVSQRELTSIAKSIHGGAHKWSRRDIASHPYIGDDRARDLLAALERGGFLHYPAGRNHPDGAQLTAKGRALVNGLIK
jgi:hypothetical protein